MCVWFVVLTLVHSLTHGSWDNGTRVGMTVTESAAVPPHGRIDMDKYPCHQLWMGTLACACDRAYDGLWCSPDDRPAHLQLLVALERMAERLAQALGSIFNVVLMIKCLIQILNRLPLKTVLSPSLSCVSRCVFQDVCHLLAQQLDAETFRRDLPTPPASRGSGLTLSLAQSARRTGSRSRVAHEWERVALE